MPKKHTEHLPAENIPAPQLQTGSNRTPGFSTPGRVMLASLLAAGAAFGSTLPVWIRAEVTTVVETRTLEISGADAASAVSALALVALAAAIAVRITGPRLKKLVSLIMALVGGGIAVSAFNVYQNPQAAAFSEVSSATGTTAAANFYELTPMPWLAVAAGALVALCGIWAFFASSRWAVGRKYDRAAARAQRVRTDEDVDDIDTWDALSDGIDPTDR
ncbi:MAG: Trp biosynthesis-associated membrane protein [Rothia sp. (in: high G+C Gram-positive bacteria)]|nr:Trp biosynthesis-associated membrane protein [Rothia sp. (in: high G+C Gram-positive bacteria)]